MEGRRGQTVALSAGDRVYLRRAYELARRGAGSTSPNPQVGALVVRDARTLGEGRHHRYGGPHAEVEALHAAAAQRHDVRGATLYVSLEPCNHFGKTPPCSEAVVAAGIERVVIGTLDPNPRTAQGGVRRLREAGIAVEVADDDEARRIIEPFEVSFRVPRPYLTLKLAASLDGYVAPRRGAYWLTGEPARAYVRDLRAAHDALLVGAGTVRIDNPRLTTRPHVARARPYLRVVACETDTVDPGSSIFAPGEEAPQAYARTIVLAPRGIAERFAPLAAVAEVLFVGEPEARELDLSAALVALRERGITSLLCEGGPTLAARLIARGLVDRLTWLVAPTLLRNDDAVPALAGADLARLGAQLRFDDVERLGDDVLLSARISNV